LVFTGGYSRKNEGGYFMQAQVKTWGNSQGIRISKEILKAANIRASKTGITNCYYILQ
jgi:predicted DNA binding CopG/RHH family protein